MVVVEVRETKRWRWGRWNIYTGRCCARLREGRAHGKPGMEEGRGVKHGRCTVLGGKSVVQGNGRTDRGTTGMRG